MDMPPPNDEGKRSMDNIVMTAEADPSRQFNIFTGILKAGGSEEEGMTLSGVASSSVKDHHGDLMKESAIRDMEMQATAGLTIFLNHEYKVPEDVAGSTTGARAVNRGTDGDGNPIWDLDVDIDINSENPRAVEAWRSIRKKGTKLGLSIGANIPKDGFDINDDGRYDIEHVNLLETSIVGIPANPRSWISKAVDALPPILEEDLVEEVKSEEVEAAPPADDREDEEVTVVAETSPEQPDEDQDDKPEAESDPDEVVPLEGETAVVSAAIESLDAVESEEVTLTHLQMAVDIARSAVEQNVALTKKVDEALQAKAEADRERTEAIEGTGKILAGVHDLLEELGNTPLGRKTAPAVKQAQRKLAHLEGIYGPEIMKMLE